MFIVLLVGPSFSFCHMRTGVMRMLAIFCYLNSVKPVHWRWVSQSVICNDKWTPVILILHEYPPPARYWPPCLLLITMIVIVITIIIIIHHTGNLSLTNKHNTFSHLVSPHPQSQSSIERIYFKNDINLKQTRKRKNIF